MIQEAGVIEERHETHFVRLVRPILLSDSFDRILRRSLL